MAASPIAATVNNPGTDDDEEKEDGIEVELDDPEEQITDPFNPEEIRIRTVPLLVSQLISRIEHGEIDLAPDFQRMSGIWNDKQKSRLVESLLLRIPIPVFYVAADNEDNWSVVDGIQRMTTLNDYVTGKFALGNLQYLASFNGCKYEGLPRPMQRRIDETSLVVNVIEPGTPPEVMFNVFLRINTGGLTLNGQEIRHALHPGPVREYLKDLAESQALLEATDNSIGRGRMLDRECVLRFLAFHIEAWEKFKDNSLDDYLGNTMDKLNEMSHSERQAIAEQFENAMRAAYRIFGDDAFRKRNNMEDRRSPVSKALFETWSVQLARCSPKEVSSLVRRKKRVRRAFIDLMNSNSEFDRAISYSTSTPARVRLRFRAIKELVEGLV